MIKTYSVIGLGKLGGSMAAAIASRGFKVIGVDVNQRAVELLNQGHAPAQETGLEELVAANRSRLQGTLSHREAVLNSDLSFVIVPTPSDERGAFSLQYAAWAFKEMGRALKEKKGYHNVVLTSTVLPGSCRFGLIPILERESGKVCGQDFGFCYSPEFIALGSIIRDFLNPDFTLVGEIDERAGAQLESCYADIMMNNSLCKRMSLENAELTKISLNTFVTTKITFANMLADLCEHIPGGDVDVVCKALGLDTRIGPKYLVGALGYGGPCFPRDNQALNFIAQAIGRSADLAATTDNQNRSFPEKIAKRLQSIIKQGSTVAILGLAYKPFSHITEESQGIYIAQALLKTGARVIGYDPLANEMARNDLHGKALILDSLEDCLAQAEIVLITTPDPSFRKLTAADFNTEKSPVTVIDFWRFLDQELADKPNINYIPIGRCIDEKTSSRVLMDLWGKTTEGTK
jgi:UDPglucose 6-dehydrogenase